MQQHIDWIAFLVGGAAAIVGHLFDVPPSVLWVALIGSVAGIAASEHGIVRSVLLIVIVTPATGWILPWLMHFLPAPALKGLAFIVSFVLVAYWSAVRRRLPQLIDAALERLITLLRGHP